MTDTALAEENALLKARLAETEAALADAVEAQRRLESIVSELRREKFGRRSEKLDPEQFNLPLEDVELAQGVLDAAQEKARRALKGQGAAERGVPKRNRGHALRFLEGYHGRFVQCDGYEAYDKLTKVDRPEGPWTLVHCWTHARRRFVKRLEKDGSPIAEETLRQIAELYAVEKSVRGLGPEARLAARRELSAPIIAAFRPWLEAQLSRIPRSSKLAEDIRYTLARWPGLTRFLEDGRLELDTNPVENQVRKIALTRKNALFAGHEVGAENWALLASLIANCKMCDVDPVSYLSDTLRALLDGHPRSRIEELMPWNFAVASSRAA